MSAPTKIPVSQPPFLRVKCLFRQHVEPHLTPFNLMVMAVLGAITTVFVVVIGLAILIATNFNPLGFIE